jgi:methylenetetrahydrofolate--tRNA-(uracil-5-)-methyltransferase
LKPDHPLHIIGGGLAGCEAAWQAGKRGIPVRLYEMRPARMTPAHQTGSLAELVCSNSFRSDMKDTAAGLLKEEMARLDSLIMRAARAARVPSGSALAVDREAFSACVTAEIQSLGHVEIVRKEMSAPPEAGVTLIATGPMTSPAMTAYLIEQTGRDHLYFFDAIAPLIEADSIDRKIAFPASRYGKGEGGYLNCPMDRAAYEAFHRALVGAGRLEMKGFDRGYLFEGCLPIEEMAERGRDTLRFGPMKPVGLTDPETGARPYAVVQLRQDDKAASLYSLVGFQSRLSWPEQKRVFRMIPGLARARFVRLGTVHRNTYLNGPALLHPTYQLRANRQVFIAGQLSGVEGYPESAASGLAAGLYAARLLGGGHIRLLPDATAIGSLGRYISTPGTIRFQPMKCCFGIMPEPRPAIRQKKPRREKIIENARAGLDEWIRENA